MLINLEFRLDKSVSTIFSLIYNIYLVSLSIAEYEEVVIVKRVKKKKTTEDTAEESSTKKKKS